MTSSPTSPTGRTGPGPTGIGTFLVQQLLLTFTALVVAMAIGLPLALYAGHRRRGGFLAVNVSNVGRAVPVFAVLLVLSLGPIGSEQFGPFGRAGLATLIALVLFALPPLITNAYVGVTEVDDDVIESSRTAWAWRRARCSRPSSSRSRCPSS